MSEMIKQISKDSILPISIGALAALLAALVTGVWHLKGAISDWETRLGRIESKLGSRWSYYMEREAWNEFHRENPSIKIPDIKTIRDDYIMFYE